MPSYYKIYNSVVKENSARRWLPKNYFNVRAQNKDTQEVLLFACTFLFWLFAENCLLWGERLSTLWKTEPLISVSKLSNYHKKYFTLRKCQIIINMLICAGFLKSDFSTMAIYLKVAEKQIKMFFAPINFNEVANCKIRYSAFANHVL